MKPFLFVLLALLSVEARVLSQDDSYILLRVGTGIRIELTGSRCDAQIPPTKVVSYKISLPHFVVFYEDSACRPNVPGRYFGRQFPIIPSSNEPTLCGDNVPLLFWAKCFHTSPNPLEALEARWDRIGNADAESKQDGHLDLSEPDILDT